MILPTASQAACLSDALTIDEKHVAVTLCPEAPTTTDGETSIGITEQVRNGEKSSTAHGTIHALEGSGQTHAVLDIPLSDIGFPGSSLHLTLRYSNGKLAIEHALRLPGPDVLR